MDPQPHSIDRDGLAFGRAFASARACAANPEARAELHRAVTELVESGAILPQEALDFEDTLITSGGGIMNASRCLGL